MRIIKKFSIKFKNQIYNDEHDCARLTYFFFSSVASSSSSISVSLVCYFLAGSLRFFLFFARALLMQGDW